MSISLPTILILILSWTNSGHRYFLALATLVRHYFLLWTKEIEISSTSLLRSRSRSLRLRKVFLYSVRNSSGASVDLVRHGWPKEAWPADKDLVRDRPIEAWPADNTLLSSWKRKLLEGYDRERRSGILTGIQTINFVRGEDWSSKFSEDLIIHSG